MYLKYFLVFLLFFPSVLWAQTLSLKDVIRLALKQSRQKEIIEKKIETDELIKVQAQLPFNWTLGSGWNRPYEDLGTSSDLWSSSVFLQKKLLLGTTLTASYVNSYTLPTELPPILPLTNPFYLQRFSLRAEQNLLRNFFGREDRWRLHSTYEQFNATFLSRKEETKQLILLSAEKFWNSYTAFFLLKQAKKRSQDYKNLVEIAQRRNRIGDTQPGEIPQVLSRYERALKTERDTRTQLKNANIDLKSFLQIESKSIQFNSHKPLSLPKFLKIESLDNLNQIKIAESTRNSLQSQVKSQELYFLPYVKLKAEVGQTGFHQQNYRQALELFQNTENRQYSIGIEFQYPIPSSLIQLRQHRTLKAKKLQHELEYQDRKQIFKNQLESSEIQLKNAHRSLNAYSEIYRLQQQALYEIRTAYIQGRASLDVLITTQDRTAEVEIENIQAQRSYNLSLLRYLSLRDKLLKRFSP